LFLAVSVGFAPTWPFWGAPIGISGAVVGLPCQQHFFVKDPSGQVVCSAGAANTVNFF
jgi:hypothetical protein